MRPWILLVSCLTATASGQIVNGDFETGTLSGWTVELGQHSSGTGCGTLDFSGTGSSPVPGVSIYDAGTTLPAVDMSLLPDPFQGDSMALLNDTSGQYHACRLSQTFPLTALDLADGGVLAMEWGAVLEDPGHGGGCQPWFQLEVLTSCGVTQQLLVDATDAATLGWLDVALPGSPVPFYYKHDVWCVDLSSCPAGTSVTVRITAADCAHGGHAGCAFLDDVRFLKCTPTPEGMVAWWHDDSGEDIALSNDYIKHGTWASIPGSGKVGSESALLFDGTNYAEVPCHSPSFHFDANQGFAIDMWVYPQTPLPFGAPLISKYFWHAAWGAVYDFHLEDRYLALTLRAQGSGAFTTYVCTDARVSFDEWTHIAVSVDRDPSANTVTFYINGEPRDVFSTLSGTNQNGVLNPAWMTIGYSNIEYGSPDPIFEASYFNGRMDEIEFFNRALSDAEVEAIFQSGCLGKCKPISFTDWVSGLPGLSIASLPAFPIGTTGTGVDAPSGGKAVVVHPGPVGPVTSIWDGRYWGQSTIPGPQVTDAAMTWDARREVAVLMGTSQRNGNGEIWEWVPGTGGGRWRQVTSVTLPALRGQALAYHDALGETILYDGLVLHRYDGSRLLQVSSSSRPRPRTHAGFAYDKARGELLLFGGRDANGVLLNDTWAWDGAVWSQRTQTQGPAGRAAPVMVYDEERESVLLFGGQGQAGDRSDTWEYDGRSWMRPQVTNVPPARHGAVAFFDRARHKVAMLGGSAPADGMWYFRSRLPATARPFGSGCPGQNGLASPELNARGVAWLGGQPELHLERLAPNSLAVFLLGFTNATSPFGPLPVNLGALGLDPSCFLLVDPAIVLTLPSANGAVRLPLRIPNDPVFAALPYYAQGMAIEVLRMETALSAGVEVSIGRK